MAAKRLTLAKVEITEFAVRELLACVDLPGTARTDLTAALALVTTLRPVPVPGRHDPVLYAPGTVGCSCGYCPDRRAATIGLYYGAYRSHLARIGVSRDLPTAELVHGPGPKEGQVVH